MNIKNNNLIKKIGIQILIFAMLLLSSCGRSYPITIYDTDLSKDQRNAIIKRFEDSLKENDDIASDSEVDDELQYIPQDLELDEEYILYEDSTKEQEIETNSNFPVVVLFKNQPNFNLKEYEAKCFENYADLDSLGRVGIATAMLGKETMPEGTRESIGMIKPSGWHTVKYDNIDGNYLYNRCHLIGWQLSAENVNEKNLFTGTRFLNVAGMLPYENQVAEYIRKTGNHVLYRVTPYFMGSNLVASHVQIEAMSYEDNGSGISFNVKLENIQPGIHINYANGDSFEEGIVASPSDVKEGDAL